ncbi:macro domain-containing protein [Vibrio maritimus]|uniref:macro domain-containing protein n=1 Tax=Vibrio maritimus TaxID=990268 RepID=UPI0037357834
MLTHVTGNIFDSKRQTIVNAVNCVGVMGAGIALEYRFRYPEMYEKYQQFCEVQSLDIGKLWIYKADANRWVLNFPTKKDWKHPTKEEYLHQGLTKFVDEYKSKNVESVAFPLLGADRGGLGQDKSVRILEQYLSDLDIPVDIYHYDPNAKDELCEKVRTIVMNHQPAEFSDLVSFRESELIKLRAHFDDPGIKQISNLLKIKGIGQRTVEKLYQLSSFESSNYQQTLL